MALAMHTTKTFQIGSSQVINIPDELAFEPTVLELEIERVGDELRIRPVRRSLAGVLGKFAEFGAGFMADGRGNQEQRDRDEV